MVAPLQGLDTLNVNSAAAMAFNFGAHANQHFGQVGDFGFLRGVFEYRLALCQRSCHQKVFGSCDGDHVGGNACAFESSSAVGQTGHHVAMLNGNLGAHGLQALDVLIDRA